VIDELGGQCHAERDQGWTITIVVREMPMNGRNLNDGEKQELVAQIHEGVPNAKLDFEEVLNIRIEGEGAVEPDPEAPPKERLRISLDRLNVNIHNQSFGMISASTGCISNPGGPSC
jgi:hypothetical protein